MTVTTETNLSTPYRALRTVLKPLKPLLVKPGKPQAAGSPRIKNAPSSKHGFKIVERQENDVWMYDLMPDVSNNDKSAVTASSGSASAPRAHQRHIYYFSGGAFQSLPTGGHWSTVAWLAKKVFPYGYRMTLVSYPLAPNTPAIKSLPILQNWFGHILATAAEKGEYVQLMGDSSGGNVALSLTFWAAKHSQASIAQQQQQQQQQQQHTSSTDSATSSSSSSNRSSGHVLTDTIVISPATDMHNSHPEMASIAKLDPLLSPSYTGGVADRWSRDLDRDDPSISPVFHTHEDFEQLRSLGIKIHGVVGTYDVLAPDALKFKDLCVKFGVGGDWLVWEGQMHCFPLTSPYGIKEGKEAMEWMAEVLRVEAAGGQVDAGIVAV